MGLALLRNSYEDRWLGLASGRSRLNCPYRLKLRSGYSKRRISQDRRGSFGYLAWKLADEISPAISDKYWVSGIIGRKCTAHAEPVGLICWPDIPLLKSAGDLVSARDALVGDGVSAFRIPAGSGASRLRVNASRQSVYGDIAGSSDCAYDSD